MKTSGSMTRLVITGEPDGRRHGIIVDRQAVSLREEPFRTLLTLVAARLSSGNGELVRLPPNAVCRLRRAIGKIIGEDEGYRLVSGGRGSKYAWAMESNEVTLRPAFWTCPFDDSRLRVCL